MSPLRLYLEINLTWLGGLLKLNECLGEIALHRLHLHQSTLSELKHDVIGYYSFCWLLDVQPRDHSRFSLAGLATSRAFASHSSRSSSSPF